MADALEYSAKYFGDDPIEKIEMCEGKWTMLFRSGKTVIYDLGMIYGPFGFPKVLSRLSVRYHTPIT